MADAWKWTMDEGRDGESATGDGRCKSKYSARNTRKTGRWRLVLALALFDLAAYDMASGRGFSVERAHTRISIGAGKPLDPS